MEIDNTLIAAIITSVATLIAAFITIASSKKTNENIKDTDKYSILNKIYTILERKSDNTIVVVKDGFSWAAFFFHIFWILYSKLWEVIFTIILVLGGLFVHFYIIDHIASTNFLYYYGKFLGFMLLYSQALLGTFGNRLLIRKYTKSPCLLDNRNYRVVDSIVATTKENALLKYMEKQNND